MSIFLQVNGSINPGMTFAVHTMFDDAFAEIKDNFQGNKLHKTNSSSNFCSSFINKENFDGVIFEIYYVSKIPVATEVFALETFRLLLSPERRHTIKSC